MEDRENGDEYYIMANLMPSSKFNEYVDARILQLTARSQSGDGSTNNPTGNNQEFN